MAEPTLSGEFIKLRREVGYKLGFGRDVESFSVDELEAVDSCIESGLRQFYSPPLLPNQPKSHSWSFLFAALTVTTVADQYNYDLPDDFRDIDRYLTYPIDEKNYVRIEYTSESMLRHFQANAENSGDPRMFAIIPKASTPSASAGQRWELWLFPTPSEVWALRGRYAINPNMITTAAPFPYGAMEHYETILHSCLAVAEEREDDNEGISRKRFLENLAASISRDMEKEGMNLGYNNDGPMPQDPRYWNLSSTGHAYNGTTYP